MPLHNTYIYKPPFWAKNPVGQTTLNRMKIRRWGENPMIENAEEIIITTGDGKRCFIGPFLRTSWYKKVVLQLIKDQVFNCNEAAVWRLPPH